MRGDWDKRRKRERCLKKSLGNREWKWTLTKPCLHFGMFTWCTSSNIDVNESTSWRCSNSKTTFVYVLLLFLELVLWLDSRASVHDVDVCDLGPRLYCWLVSSINPWAQVSRAGEWKVSWPPSLAKPNLASYKKFYKSRILSSTRCMRSGDPVSTTGSRALC